ncbi:D-glucuronyl C5-epimerase family protein [Agromyces bauzanensis]
MSSIVARLAFSLAAVLSVTGCVTEPAAPAVEPPASVEATPRAGDWPFATNGWEIDAEAMSPINDRIQIDLETAEVDDTGVAVYRDPSTGEPAEHPIVYAQYAIAALLEWEETGDDEWLEAVERNAQELVDVHVERDGAWWFQYDWNWTYYERTLTAPWWSGMAQGEALAVFSRLAVIRPENPFWREAADHTFASFLQRDTGDGKPWSTLIDGDHLWFEEYAGDQPPLLVMNGHVFAIYGLFEYFVLTGDETVAAYIDGGATTILESMPLFRAEGGVSYYCSQADYCRSPDWQNQSYHPIHISQLRTLGRITGDERFSQWASVLEQDWSPEG